MPTIIIKPELVSQVERIARSQNVTVEQLVNQAVHEHITRLEDEKLATEARAFEQMHPQLVKDYFGQFVAMHEGRVIDHDEDFEVLFLRVREQYEDIPILIRRVAEKPVVELRAPSPRLEWATDR